MDDELNQLDREIKIDELGFHLVVILLFSGLGALALMGFLEWWTSV